MGATSVGWHREDAETRRRVRWQAFWVIVLMAVIAMSWLVHEHPWEQPNHHHVHIGSVRPE